MVQAAGGCGDTGTIVVNVYTLLRVPGGFTPNGDGHNDLFYVLGGPSSSMIEDFSVFSRWGQKVFQAHNVHPGDPGGGWNGTIGSQPAPPGTYVYIVVVRNTDGSRQVVKGTVVLIR
jgi:gliding motility-associated-like protein